MGASTLWLPGAFLGFFLIWFAFVAACVAVWIWGLVDAARRPDWAYKMAGSDKTLWIVLIAVLGFILAIVYLAAIRPRVRAAEAGGVAWTCPRCRSLLRGGDAFCAACGLRVA